MSEGRFILTAPNGAASIPTSFGGLLEGQTHWSSIAVCPVCGLSWGMRKKVGVPTQFSPDRRRCLEHGDGCILLGFDFTYAAQVLSDLSPQTLEYLVNEYFRIGPSLLTRDSLDSRYDSTFD